MPRAIYTSIGTGTCSVCRNRYRPGDKLVKRKGLLTHVNCGSTAVAPKPERVPITPQGIFAAAADLIDRRGLLQNELGDPNSGPICVIHALGIVTPDQTDLNVAPLLRAICALRNEVCASISDWNDLLPPDTAKATVVSTLRRLSTEDILR